MKKLIELPFPVLYASVFILLSLSSAVTCGAATFEKVSVSYSMTRGSGVLQCPEANNPPDLSWTSSHDEIDGFNIGSTFWSHTPTLRKNTALLVSIDSLENVGSGMFSDQPSEEGVSRPLDAGGQVYNRVNAYTFQRPILEVWNPAYGSNYSVNMSVTSGTIAYYRIKALEGESDGDEVTLQVQGTTEATHNASGPQGTAIIQVIGSAGVTGFNNVAYIPGYVNESDGVWQNVNGIRYFTARIGDVIGLRASVYSSIGPVIGEPIKNWMRDHYSPCSLFTSSWVNAVIVPKPLPGDMDGNRTVTIDDAIVALQVLSGRETYMLRYDYAEAGVDVDGDNRVGLAEVIYVMQTAAGLRQN